MSYQDTVYTYRNRTSKPSLFVGGIITPILIACDVYLDDSDSVAHGWLDIPYLKRAKVLEYKEVQGMYVYKFDHPDGGEAKILLPHQAHTTFRNGKNVDFHPPSNTLYHEGQGQAAPEPMEEDIQEDEEMAEPEMYYFEDYPYQGSGPAVVAAHKCIGLLQKLNKWHGKALDKLSKAVDSMSKTIKNL
uniref:Arabidopsis retrotransposon Orf1 C-terminal domain-containing protein n=1 Tax=Noccaea caerulescens TaxID=107243 RepID=A0A1J3IZ60_NOCCA